MLKMQQNTKQQESWNLKYTLNSYKQIVYCSFRSGNQTTLLHISFSHQHTTPPAAVQCFFPPIMHQCGATVCSSTASDVIRH